MGYKHGASNGVVSLTPTLHSNATGGEPKKVHKPLANKGDSRIHVGDTLE